MHVQMTFDDMYKEVNKEIQMMLFGKETHYRLGIEVIHLHLANQRYSSLLSQSHPGIHTGGDVSNTIWKRAYNFRELTNARAMIVYIPMSIAPSR